MKYNTLGSSALSVSEVCLGTMTFGIQNNQQDADEQLAIALDAGVNFIDTAEMYPVPPGGDTYGDTERILGDWFSRHSDKRESLILMTKIAGPGFKYIRGSSPISKESIPVALGESLKRLQTDYVDVYQLHWPNRTSPHFSKHWPDSIDPTKVDIEQERGKLAGIVEALGDAIKQGKIRHWGLSDDTPWGIHTFISMCDAQGVPRPVSIQNEFSLVHGKDWPYLIESCIYENVAYLPWSPLGAGVLTGKYLNGARPEGSRWTIAQRMGLFRDTQLVNEAVAEYVAIADKHGMTPAQLALQWVKSVPGVTSTIIGATKTAQLHEDLKAFSLPLNQACLEEVNRVYKRFPVPF